VKQSDISTVKEKKKKTFLSNYLDGEQTPLRRVQSAAMFIPSN
jgi:hypothetical protein